MNGDTEKLASKLGLVRRYKPSGLFKGKLTSPSSFLPDVPVIVPQDHLLLRTPLNSVTIKRVGHGWVRTYHIETRTTKEFIPLWNKHTTMPLMRFVLMGGSLPRSQFHLHSLRTLTPPPHV